MDGERNMNSGQPTPANVSPERKAQVFSYLERVISGETPPCDPETGAFLGGLVMGLRVSLLEQVHYLKREQATAASVRWVKDQARLYGSLAAMADGAGEPE